MSPSAVQSPEPLRMFRGLESGLAGPLDRIRDGFDRYGTMLRAGRILPNSVDAVRVELTYHSNAIEGSTLTLRETQLVIEGRTPAGGKSLREVYEARNHDRALRLVEGWAAQATKDEALAERHLLDVHAMVMAEVDDQHAGRFRTDRVLIKGTRFIPPGSQKFGELIPALLELANDRTLHPVVRAAEAHYNLVAVHPFADGNGRTARLLMNYLLLREGYPLTVVEIERRGEYLAALEEANAGRCAAFAGFVAGCAERSIGRLIGDGA
jgi:Fic family protein